MLGCLLVFFIFGICIGSFLNVCIYRIPKKENITTTRSHCMECGNVIKWYDLVPVLSFIILGGKCRYCKTKLSAQYPIIELLNGLLYCLVYAVMGLSIRTVLTCAVCSALLVIAVIDWRTYEIPFGLNVFIGCIGVINLTFDYQNFVNYLVGAICVSGFLFILYIITKGRGIGGGDIKLMAAAGLFLGWKSIILALVIGCILGSIIHLIRMKVSKAEHVLAFGPYLAAGILISSLWGNDLIGLYLSFYF